MTNGKLAASISSLTYRTRLGFVIAGCIAYHGFVLLLLFAGSGHDAKIAIQFLANSPVFALWIVALWRQYDYCYAFGLVAATIQFAIFLINGGGMQMNDWMMINATIIVLVLAATTVVEPRRLRNAMAAKPK